MKLRIKQKGDLEYAKFYPQKKSWKTVWSWEHFYEPWYIVYPDIKEYHHMSGEKRTELVFKTYEEAEKYLENYRKNYNAKHFKKTTKI